MISFFLTISLSLYCLILIQIVDMRISLITALTFFGCFILRSQQLTPTEYPDLTRKVDLLINDGIKNKAFPGAQVMIYKKDSIRLNKTYGYHTYDSINPVSKEHLYDLASVTKVLGSTLALMKLYESYGLDLDKEVASFIPLLKRSNKKNHTLKEILSHNAGWTPYITHQNMVYKNNGAFKGNTLSKIQNSRFPNPVSDNLFVHKRYQNKIMRRIKKTPLEAKVEMVYSGLIYFLIPKLVQEMTGQAFDEFLNTQFYKPMGLKRLGFLPRKKFNKDVIVPTEKDTLFRKQLVHGWVHDEAASLMGGISGNAGLFANATSIAPLLQMLLNKGNYKGTQYLKPETIELFSQRTYPQGDNPRGLGFDKPSLDLSDPDRYPSPLVSPKTFGHTGYTGTMVWVDPASECFVILLTNRVYPFRSQRGLYQLNIRPQLLDYAIQY